MSKTVSSASALRTGVLSIIATASFYAIAPKLPQVGEFVTRYFCSHPLEYISTGMFFTGMTILMQKYLQLGRERKILKTAHAAIAAGFMKDEGDVSRETMLGHWCEQLPAKFKTTQLHQRITDTLHYLRGSGRSGVEEHLR